MLHYEYFPDGDIVVARQGVDPALAAQLVLEWEKLNNGSYGVSSDAESPTPVETKDGCCGSLPINSAAAAISKLVIGETYPRDDIALNKQHPLSFQYFHPDGQTHPVAVVHASDAGAFEYVVLGADPHPHDNHDINFSAPHTVYAPNPEDVKTIELATGDVLIQLGNVIHRGRNLSTEVRVTAGLYRK
jgi:hypothetical protein